MANAVGYLRCSTGAQVESHLGLEAQRAGIEDAAKRLGLPLVAVFSDEGLSGGLALADRPGLLDAVNALGRGDVLLCARRDRVGRDVVNVALAEREIAKRGARLVSAAGEGSELEGPTGHLVRTILDAVNAHEKAVIALRTRLALRAKRRRGEMTGAAPFGFALGQDGRTLVAVPEEQDALSFVRARRSEGASFREIASELNAKGVRAKRGGFWLHTSVRSVLATAARQSA